ncbi:hypothetical protein MMC06_006682, partial [Schaereria dolodes]|nr:hypothetical protein [Schaereria dolodes]
MSSPTSPTSSNRSSWQEMLQGGRTAWSSTVTLSSIPTTISARYWYDGQYVHNAKEDAAEVAYRTLTTSSSTNLSQQSPVSPGGVNGLGPWGGGSGQNGGGGRGQGQGQGWGRAAAATGGRWGS